MTNASLTIKPQQVSDPKQRQYELEGTIDVQAIPALETLYDLPKGSTVTLDFDKVQRVNSMGLAQLLKLFEHWQGLDITIAVNRPNRMINMLFKMTGLTRFLINAAAAEPSPAGKSIAAHQAKPSPGENVPDRQEGSSSPRADGKLHFLADLESTQHLEGWYFFNTFLQRRLERSIYFEPVHGALGEKKKPSGDVDLVFAKPFDAARLLIQSEFTPLLRPSGQADEVTIIARKEDQRNSLADYAGARIVTTSPDTFVYLLGRFLLDESELPSDRFSYLWSGHDIKAVQMLLKGEADLLFMVSKAYRGLSSITRKMLREVGQSETDFAYQLLCLHPRSQPIGGQVRETLLNMGRDSHGRQILGDLGMEGWSDPAREEVGMLTSLYQRYLPQPVQ